MAARRRSSSRSPSRSSNAGPAILAGLVMVALIVGAVAMFGQGGSKASENSNQKKQAAKVLNVVRQPGKVLSSQDKGKKQPDRPAPRLSAAKLADCRKHYDAAKAAYNLGLKEQQGRNDKVIFQKHLRAAVDQIDMAYEIMDAVLLWEEEADMDDWIVPEHIRPAMKLFGTMAKLRSRALKVLPSK